MHINMKLIAFQNSHARPIFACSTETWNFHNRLGLVPRDDVTDLTLHKFQLSTCNLVGWYTVPWRWSRSLHKMAMIGPGVRVPRNIEIFFVLGPRWWNWGNHITAWMWWHDAVCHRAGHCMKWPHSDNIHIIFYLGRPRVLSFSQRLDNHPTCLDGYDSFNHPLCFAPRVLFKSTGLYLLPLSYLCHIMICYKGISVSVTDYSCDIWCAFDLIFTIACWSTFLDTYGKPKLISQLYILGINVCCFIYHKAICWMRNKNIIFLFFIVKSPMDCSTLNHFSISWVYHLFFMVWNNIVFHILNGVRQLTYTL